jgi:hypothetical protein
MNFAGRTFRKLGIGSNEIAYCAWIFVLLRNSEIQFEGYRNSGVPRDKVIYNPQAFM